MAKAIGKTTDKKFKSGVSDSGKSKKTAAGSVLSQSNGRTSKRTDGSKSYSNKADKALSEAWGMIQKRKKD